MRFAKVVFTIAGVWGIVVLTPLYFLFDISGRVYPPPADYPQFFFGFVSVAMAWQIAFLIIGSNPARFRPLMLVSAVEKFSYIATLLVLLARGRIATLDVSPAIPDSILGILFVVSFVKTRTSAPVAVRQPMDGVR